MPYVIHTYTENRWPPDHARRAVATLAEVVRELNATGVAWSLDGANGEGGGTTTLPNGTVIEVTRTTWASLAHASGGHLDWPESQVGVERQQGILTAFNNPTKET